MWCGAAGALLLAATACAASVPAEAETSGPPFAPVEADAAAGGTSGTADALPVPDPGWRIHPLGGGETTLGELRGSPVFVNLWATWCPPCVAEIGSIGRLAEAVRRAGHGDVRFLLVSAEEAATVRDFARRRLPELPDGVTLALEGSLAPEAFGELVLPTTVILDADGRMVLRHRGAAAWDDPAVVKLLAGLARETGG